MKAIQGYADVIVATVDNLVPKGSGLAYAVSVRIEIHDFEADEELPAVRGYLHLVCHAPANYMSVFAALTQRPVPRYQELDWALVCHHDSAWRDDGIRATMHETFRSLMNRAGKVFARAQDKLSVHLAIENMKLSPVAEVLAPNAFKVERRKLDLQGFADTLPN